MSKLRLGVIGVMILSVGISGAGRAISGLSFGSLQRLILPVVQIQTDQKPRRATSEARWEPVFFRIIEERSSQAKIPDLRTVLPPDDGFEVRVWIGFGINGEDCIILRRSSKRWSAVHLHGMAERPPFSITLKDLDAPSSGWEAAWQKLTQAGILTLPDATTVGCNTHMFDGTSYVVEINENKTYRTYLYDNPKYARCSEAKQVLRIGEIIAQEFGLKEFKI